MIELSKAEADLIYRAGDGLTEFAGRKLVVAAILRNGCLHVEVANAWDGDEKRSMEMMPINQRYEIGILDQPTEEEVTSRNQYILWLIDNLPWTCTSVDYSDKAISRYVISPSETAAFWSSARRLDLAGRIAALAVNGDPRTKYDALDRIQYLATADSEFLEANKINFTDVFKEEVK